MDEQVVLDQLVADVQIDHGIQVKQVNRLLGQDDLLRFDHEVEDLLVESMQRGTQWGFAQALNQLRKEDAHFVVIELEVVLEESGVLSEKILSVEFLHDVFVFAQKQ